ncbi:hypothetical protein GCM10007925_05660 [Sphingomonas astaxanthinifaciens DSM 22298]|uniref:Uncharacterized protein n=1 Tax=Sphingomonas astaxanthinifaciens DSM 22298 TaxID=1123267 RepID=A0ABQ5Z272_9SPHN|nr:hypothetical protein GCM10007925_05660 [Sphingomonas astaxanthinifaciens DSM 22298]
MQRDEGGGDRGGEAEPDHRLAAALRVTEHGGHIGRAAALRHAGRKASPSPDWGQAITMGE